MKTKERIRQAIKNIIQRKDMQGIPFPSAHSVEVALMLKMNARDVESIVADMDDIVTHLTINGEYYEA